MKKEDLFQALVVAEYVAFVLATILVLVFQFLGVGLLITLSLAMYVVAFALCCFENIVLCVGLFKINNKELETGVPRLEIKAEDGEQISVKDAKENIKARKIKAVALSIISGLIAIFTLVVMILFN